MEVLFLGTGSCRPTPKKDNKPLRTSTGFLIKVDDKLLLFDIGHGALHKMLISGIDILETPTHLFITHFHPDHCADIIPLMQGRAVAKRDGYDIKPLTIYGPAGTNTFFENLFSGVEKWKDGFGQGFRDEIFRINEFTEGSIIDEEGFKITGIPVRHFDSIAYRLDTKEGNMIYSGDMGYDENFVTLGHDADLAIMECSFPDKNNLTGNHLCPEDIGQLAKLGNFKQIALTHLYPECEGREDEMVEKINEFTHAEVAVAHDLFKLRI